MINQSQLKKKALATWNSGAFLSARVRNEQKKMFPIEIRFRTPGGKALLEQFDAVRTWINTLRKNSKEYRSKGYDIVWEMRQHRTLGIQHLPQRIFFLTPADWLFFIGKEKEDATFLEMITYTHVTLPGLADFLSEYPLKALSHAADWSKLIRVCQWFSTHPCPGKFIRELDIAGVDTKFIESKKALLMAVLPLVLQTGNHRTEIKGLSRHGFERKFGLKYDPPLIRFRLLDPDLIKIGFSDMSVPLWELIKNDPGTNIVFITENKINGLVFPDVKQAMVIFGLGYGVKMLQKIPWLGKKDIVYWGDIDTHGFAILSRLRSHFPKVASILMDRQTLTLHKKLWGTEDPAKRYINDLSNLTPDEYALFYDLKQDRLGPNIRLEQERIRFSILQEKLQIFS